MGISIVKTLLHNAALNTSPQNWEDQHVNGLRINQGRGLMGMDEDEDDEAGLLQPSLDPGPIRGMRPILVLCYTNRKSSFRM